MKCADCPQLQKDYHFSDDERADYPDAVYDRVEVKCGACGNPLCVDAGIDDIADALEQLNTRCPLNGRAR